MFIDKLKTFYSKIQHKWEKIFEKWPLTYLTPFSSVPTFILICSQMLWAFFFVYFEIGKDIIFKTEGVFLILSTTLSFILPLQLNTALQKNAGCLDNYQMFVAEIISFGMDIFSFHVETKKTKKNNSEQLKTAELVLEDIYDILVAIPALAKWNFRKNMDLRKLTTKNGVLFLSTEGGTQVKLLIDKIPDLSHIEACMYKMLDYVKDLKQNETQIVISASVKSWERAHQAWLNMGNLEAYKTPLIFQYAVNSMLVFYSFLLPYEFYQYEYNAIWMAGTIGYFFLGLHVAADRARNPFAHGKRLFQTVTESQHKSTKALNQMWNSRQLIFESASIRHDAYNTQRLSYYQTSKLSY